ncbi:MAG: hypothetical protein LBD58_02095, partial [Treponema sp.]|nr:hypothetical protein [Treponema sp.]
YAREHSPAVVPACGTNPAAYVQRILYSAAPELPTAGTLCAIFFEIFRIMVTAASVPPQNNKILPMEDKNEKDSCIFNDFLCRLSANICTKY